MEEQFWSVYKDQGLEIVAVDPGGLGAIQGGASTDDLPGVQAYVEHLDISYPVGLETTANYALYKANFVGQNPFPVDIIVDKNGIIRYIAREYDAPTMHQVVQELLAE
jgi:hypothetical protein